MSNTRPTEHTEQTRVLVPSDLAAVADLFKQLAADPFFCPHPFSKGEAFRVCSYSSAGRDIYCGHFRDGKLLAYGMLRGFDAGFEYPSLGIAVHPGHRNCGLGAAVMRDLHRLASDMGAKKVRLRVHPSNRAKSFYERLGYRFTGEIDRGQPVGWFDLGQGMGAPEPVRSVVAALLQYDHPQLGQAHALRALHQHYEEVDYLKVALNVSAGQANREFVDTVDRNKPDWVWMQLQDTEVITAASIEQARERSCRSVFVNWTGDMCSTVSAYLSSICKASDLTLISSVGKLGQFGQAGAKRVEYLQIGLDWAEDVLRLPSWSPNFRVPEVVFCGGYYPNGFPGTADRQKLIAALSTAGVDVGVVGSGWPTGVPVVGRCSVKEQSHVYTRAKVVLSINNFNDVEQYYSDRQLIAMASGTPVVCKYVPGLEREFVNGQHCLWYHEVDEGVAQVKKLLGNEGLRRQVGRAGRREVMVNHSWLRRFADVMARVERLRSERQ